MTARPGALVLAVSGLVAIVAVRGWASGLIPTPWILVDELIYADLARSLAAEGRLAVRGELLVTSVLYPVLIAPAWLADATETAYRLAKWINVVAMSAAALPVYLWARRLAGPRAGLAAAGLTLLLPAYVYSGSLLTANLFLPLFVVAAYALALALESPSAARWLAVLALVVLAIATHLQGLVLLPVAVTAVAAYAGLELRAGGRARGRELRPLLVWAAVPALAAAAIVAAREAAPGFLAGPYRGTFELAAYRPGEFAPWLAHDAGAVVLAAGVVPALALAVLAGCAVIAPAGTGRSERAFLAVAVSAAAWLVALAAVASTWDPVGIRERYAFYAVPLLFVALVLWLARGRPRPPLLSAAAAAAAVALVATLPLTRIFGSGSFLGDGFSLIPFWRLARVLPGGVDTARALLVAGAVAVVLLALLLPRRLAGVALPVLVALFLAASSAAVFATARSQARGVALASGQADRPTWIDETVAGEPVLYLSTRPREAPEWVPVWQAEFWNRRLLGVVDAGAAEPSPLPQLSARVLPDGRVEGLGAPPRYVLVGGEDAVAGALVAEAGGLRLFRVEPPLRIVTARQ